MSSVFRHSLIIVVLCGNTILFSQPYQPLSGNLGWCVEQYFGTGSVQNDFVNLGDSNFLGNTYTALKSYNSDTFLIREDTSLQKVWFLNPSDSMEHLIYDFSLSHQDSVEIWFYYHGILKYYVDSIYMSNGRKNIALHTLDTNVSQNLYWIEGIGSTYTPLYTFYLTGNYAGYCLICAYSSVGIPTYSGSCMIPCVGYPNQPCYSFITGIDEKIWKEDQIEISALIDKVNITSSKSMINKVLVYNSVGQLIHKQSGHSFNLEIDISTLPNGIYIFRVELQNGTFSSEKIVR